MIDRADASKELVFHPDFVWFLGAFYGAWATLELVTSYGIGKHLKIDHEETHILTSGMEFGRKAALLRNLVHRSSNPRKSEILGLVGKIQNESKRNVFAHSFIISDRNSVTFVDRKRGGDYEVAQHTFTLQEFADHVTAFTKACSALEISLEIDKKTLHDFAMAALSVNTKSTKSPVPPSVKA